MAAPHQRYASKLTRVGSSQEIRRDAALFKAHPEFGGDVQPTDLAEGQVTLSARPQESPRPM